MDLEHRTRRVAQIEDARVGDHVCWAYDDHAGFLRSVVRYIDAGLSAGERVACLLSAFSLNQIGDLFPERAHDLNLAADRGALILGDVLVAYMPSGVFDPEFRLREYESMAHQALADGFTALRVLGEATAIVNYPSWEGLWPGYELRADIMTSRSQLIAVCAYDATMLDARALAMLRSVHPAWVGETSPRPTFHVWSEREGSLNLGGELDVNTAPTFTQMSVGAVSDLGSGLLDLSNLGFIDVAGMRAVGRLASAISDSHSGVRIRGAQPPFLRMWQLMDMDSRMDARFETA